MARKLPHPIPYQGSKRILAPTICQLLPPRINILYEPFAGSAAMTIFAAQNGLAKKFILGDTLEPIIELWQLIVENPSATSKQYAYVWRGQQAESADYFNKVRDRYNSEFDPVDLLYLICRCVKNAVRFGAAGRFTQSHDKRRLGMSPEKMDAAIHGVSRLLRGKTEFRKGDWLTTIVDAGGDDFVYMDPPYMGTSIGRDKRYHQQLLPEDLAAGLMSLNARHIRFALSYDGMTGDKEYGPELPRSLEMVRLFLHAGRSSQSTLHGKSDETIESLYLSRNVRAPSDIRFGVKDRIPTNLSLQFCLD